MSSDSKEKFMKAVESGKAKRLAKIISRGIDYPISEKQLFDVINNNYESVLKVLARKSTFLDVDTTLIIACSRKNWNKVLLALLKRNDCPDISLTDNQALIQILSLGNSRISRKVLASRELEFNGSNAEVLVYLCEKRETDLVKYLLMTRYINPNYADDLFMKAAIRKESHDIVKLFRTIGNYEESEKMVIYEFLRKPCAGI